jgi:hypothetical protein
MDRKSQVRDIVKARYPSLTPNEVSELVELVWNEALREAQMARLQGIR